MWAEVNPSAAERKDGDSSSRGKFGKLKLEADAFRANHQRKICCATYIRTRLFKFGCTVTDGDQGTIIILLVVTKCDRDETCTCTLVNVALLILVLLALVGRHGSARHDADTPAYTKITGTSGASTRLIVPSRKETETLEADIDATQSIILICGEGRSKGKDIDDSMKQIERWTTLRRLWKVNYRQMTTPKLKNELNPGVGRKRTFHTNFQNGRWDERGQNDGAGGAGDDVWLGDSDSGLGASEGDPEGPRQTRIEKPSSEEKVAREETAGDNVNRKRDLNGTIPLLHAGHHNRNYIQAPIVQQIAEQEKGALSGNVWRAYVRAYVYAAFSIRLEPLGIQCVRHSGLGRCAKGGLVRLHAFRTISNRPSKPKPALSEILLQYTGGIPREPPTS
ncbi:hypothetical protein DFH07DRAFT_940743 [Mycena maculata]|uniref:Uncharacterized protein n=1 Tax=Mycena maculata TaxID=230809 RepID=A0AAD7J331_9AGAR|nr:hypothetical protein DFH07DRAFT_940743 [Mycena maculata]